MILKTHLILGSNSPRRKQILQEAGFTFDTLTLDIDESYPINLNKSKIAEYLAKTKNSAYRESIENQVLLTADTTVILKNESLEKAKDKTHAVRMLKQLSGNVHQVITGYCISDDSHQMSNAVTTNVFFKNLSSKEIEYYVEKYKPYDKAGAYGIQEWIGMIGIYKIEGSYFNVVGLPIFEISEDLKAFNVSTH